VHRGAASRRRDYELVNFDQAVIAASPAGATHRRDCAPREAAVALV